MTIPKDLKSPSLAILALVLALPLPALAAANVEFAVGDVQAVNAVGVARSLGKGARIVSSETIRTTDGRVQLRFDDGAIISLQPNTEFRIDNFRFSGQQDGKERGFFSLLKGGLRALTGLVGRVNKDAYKVTTSVATIGIRGTEYTLAYLGAESVAISTGEGAVEVCNGAGCTILVSGDSAIIEGANGAARRVDFRPQLSPAQPGEQLLPQFSTSEFRNQDGSVQINANQLTSGPGYSLAWAHSSSGGVATNGTAQFGASSQLLSATNPSGFFVGLTLGESGAADGVIGWGRWATATDHLNTALSNFHYVIGRETPLSQLAALNGVTATYQMIGFTVPTGALGNATGSPSGTLTASFGAATMNVSMALQVPYFNSMTNTTYAVNATTGTVPLGSTFTWTGPVVGGGLFSGTAASHAGATYNFNAGGYTDVSGAVAFKR